MLFKKVLKYLGKLALKKEYNPTFFALISPMEDMVKHVICNAVVSFVEIHRPWAEIYLFSWEAQWDHLEVYWASIDQTGT